MIGFITTRIRKLLLPCLTACFLTAALSASAQDAFDSRNFTGSQTMYGGPVNTEPSWGLAPEETTSPEARLWVEPITADEPIPLRGFPPIPLAFDFYGKTATQAPLLKGATNGTSRTVPAQIDTYVNAEALVREGKLEEAISRLERAYFEKPDERFASLIALALRRQNQNDLALLWEDSAGRETPLASKKRPAKGKSSAKDTALDNNNKAVRLGRKNNWVEAIRLHELAVKEAPGRAEFTTNLSSSHMQYGQWLEKQGKKAEAIDQYRLALFVDYNNSSASELLTKALGSDGSTVAARQKVAADADAKGDNQVALVEYGELAKMQPDTPSALADYAFALLKDGQTEVGYKKLRQSVSFAWPKTANEKLALCHMRLGDILKEKSYQFKDSGSGPIGMKILNNAGIEYRRSILLNYQSPEACKSFLDVAREAVGIRSSFDNNLVLAAAYLLCADYKHAQLTYNQCHCLDPRRPELGQARISYHQTIARSAVASDEQVFASVDCVKRLIDADSENARLWYILGRLREHQRDSEKAKKCYDKAWSINHLIDLDLPLAYARIGAKPPGTGEHSKPPANEPQLSVNGSPAKTDPIAAPFMQELQVRIKQNWHPPHSTESSKVVVIFKIHKDGNISDSKIETSSGKEAADQAALDAIKNSQAPPLPAGLPDPADILFTFVYNVSTPLYY